MYVMILVVGPGGVGQTYLLQYLKNEGVKQIIFTMAMDKNTNLIQNM